MQMNTGFAKTVAAGIILLVGSYVGMSMVQAGISSARTIKKAQIELGYIKPWSVHPENRAAFRANPLEVA